MRRLARFAITLLVAFMLMIAFRTLAFTILTVEGSALEPTLRAGDRVLVNRWSYGLRVGGAGSLFSYGRLARQPVSRGDLVAYENPRDTTGSQVLLGRCTALPGDTISLPDGLRVAVPSTAQCAPSDCYWMESLAPGNPVDSRTLGFVDEQHIIGRAVLVVYSHHPDSSLLRGWHKGRFLLPL